MTRQNKTDLIFIIKGISGDGIPNIDARSTGTKLKERVLKAVSPAWLKSTYGYPLVDCAWTLRDKSRVDVVQHYANVPVFYDACLSKSSKKKGTFVLGKTMEVVLQLATDDYERVAAYVAEKKAEVGYFIFKLFESMF